MVKKRLVGEWNIHESIFLFHDTGLVLCCFDETLKILFKLGKWVFINDVVVVSVRQDFYCLGVIVSIVLQHCSPTLVGLAISLFSLNCFKDFLSSLSNYVLVCFYSEVSEISYFSGLVFFKSSCTQSKKVLM